tara:strand:- start:797 stop:1852 length:1056 start_codon:yes stop_codon:yes gene_type:complete
MSYLVNPYMVSPSSSLGGWKYLDKDVLTGTADSCTVSGLSDFPFYLFFFYEKGSGDTMTEIRFGDSGGIKTGMNYSERSRYNGATSTSTGIDQTSIFYDNNFSGLTDETTLTVGYLSNFSSEEKFCNLQFTHSRGSGTGTAVSIGQGVGKVEFTTQLTDIQMIQTDTGDWLADTELVVLGYDPSDDTGGFFEELGTDSIPTGTADSLNASLSSSAKYLWWNSIVYQPLTNGIYAHLNNDQTANSYTYRYSVNGTAGAGAINQERLFQSIDDTWAGYFLQGWIVNPTSDVKLGCFHDCESDSSSAASPNLTSAIYGCKWDDTATLTSCDLDKGGSGAFTAGSQLSVWGGSPP